MMTATSQSSMGAQAPESKREISTLVERPVYEDEVHLKAIRTALSKGNAAVLVGAGFSRNAEGGKHVGTWEALATALAAAMAPAGREISASVANATQLAEQYEKLFSRSHLEQMLKTVVPDERLSPGRLHHKLLSLPWSEVFTTNYDTLLERTAERLLDSSYFTVCCREDIPLSRVLGRRRIVKLHGSFSSQRPFILTEEDYRTYPQKFAPFVNLVRQALLENVLCLVGFSGDDPNFLSWIGWVRDMLDRHALPIYLFVTEQPPHGQTLLLKARGVTPVVLPICEGGEPSDYIGRYDALLEAISPNADSNPNDWGTVEWPTDLMHYNDGDSLKNYEAFCRRLPILLVQRKTYPGWIVAPHKVRQRFRRSLRQVPKWADDKAILGHLQRDEAAFALAAIDVYSWGLSVLLDEFDDAVAEAAIQLLHATADLQFSQLSAATLARLKVVDCRSQSELKGCWTRVLLAVLAWARQTQRVFAFDKLKALAIERRSKDFLVEDHISYHSILLHLERGDMLSAQQSLGRWSVRGNDVYMLVRWAALCAEIGNISTAISTCENALQILRQQLRMSSADLQLLSEESWASLVAMYLLKAKEYSLMLGRTGVEYTSVSSSQSADALDKRIDIHAKYSSKAELRLCIEQLGREAGVPYARNFKYNEFELGTAPNEIVFGTPAAIQYKVEAASTWFQLAERVGLIPRMPGARFHCNEFLQAAWWSAYYLEQHDRALGMFLRCADEGALKPRNETRPLHETGWLSRFEVGLLSRDRAAILARQIAVLVEAKLISTSERWWNPYDLEFYSEVLSRVVIRVEDQNTVQEVALQLLSLYSSGFVAKQPKTWRSLSKVLIRCMEAMDQARQLDVILQAFKLPVAPPEQALGGDAAEWLPIYALGKYLNREQDRKDRASDWQGILDSLVELLHRPSTSSLKRGAWERLFMAHEIGLLNERQHDAIVTTLWRSWRPGHPLPVIPGYFAHAVFQWTTGHRLEIRAQYRKDFLAKEFSPFESGHILIQAKSGRSWNLPSDESQRVYLAVLGDPDIGVSSLEFLALIEKFISWLDRDGLALAEDGKDGSDLGLAVRGILSDIDLMLIRIFDRLQDRPRLSTADLITAVRTLKERASVLGSECFGLNILLAHLDQDKLAAVAALGNLEVSLVTKESDVLRSAYQVASVCLQSEVLLSSEARQSVFDAFTRVAFCFSPVPLVLTLQYLARLPEAVWQKHLNDQNLYQLDQALGLQFPRLAWGKQIDRDGIPDDAVPLLRSKCAGLASVLLERAPYRSPAAEKWLSAATNDPLPELRLGRFKD